LSDSVCGVLRQAILTKKLSPGARLYPVELATRLQVSPTPVKDALQRLAGEHLVDIRPRRGIVVTQPSVATVNEVFSVRRALECLAVEEAFARGYSDAAWADRIGHLRKLADDVAATGQSDDPNDQVMANGAFHEELVRLSANRLLYEVYVQVRPRMILARLHADRPGWRDRVKQDYLEHLAIVDGLAARDRERAVGAVSEHILGAQRRAVRDAIQHGWSQDADLAGSPSDGDALAR
ncbi:MAG: GntR family transcriptional regulator, partial [Candidatus Dormibacteraceae bacterium]